MICFNILIQYLCYRWTKGERTNCGSGALKKGCCASLLQGALSQGQNETSKDTILDSDTVPVQIDGYSFSLGNDSGIIARQAFNLVCNCLTRPSNNLVKKRCCSHPIRNTQVIQGTNKDKLFTVDI